MLIITLESATKSPSDKQPLERSESSCSCFSSISNISKFVTFSPPSINLCVQLLLDLLLLPSIIGGLPFLCWCCYRQIEARLQLRRTSSPASCGTSVPVASLPVPNASHRTSPHSVSLLPVHGSGWNVLEVPSMPSHVPSFRCENSLTAAEICGMVSMGVKLRAKWRTLLQRGIPFSKRVRFQPLRSLLQRLRGGFLSLPQSM